MNYGAIVFYVFLSIGAMCCAADTDSATADSQHATALKNTTDTEAYRILERVDTVPEETNEKDWWEEEWEKQYKLEARKKKHKYLLAVLSAGILTKLAFLPIAVAFLKLLTGKALLVTVMALMLISIISLKKIAGSGHSHHPQVINLLPSHHGRDFGSQELAYRHYSKESR